MSATTHEHHLMASPVIYKDARLDFASTLQKELQSTQATALCVTHRAPVVAGNPGNHGDDERASVELGIALVGLGESGWTFDQLQASDLTSSVDQPRPRASRAHRGTRAGQPGATTWRMPNDYPDCVAGQLLNAYPELRRVEN